jgi:predicted MFS family arabinose efflux permease
LLIGAFTTIANIAVYTSIASLKNYERGFGMFVLMQYLVSGLGLYFMILYSDYIGSQGLFLLLGLFNLIALFMIRTLPNQQANNNTESALTSETKVLFSGIALLAIIGFGIHEMSGVAQFTYIERIGVSILIDNQSLSNIMLISSLLGIPGAIICITLGKKYGLVIPILFGVSICLLGMSLFLFSKTYLTYTIRMCLMGFGWSIVLPYIQSHLANIDKKGSALAAGNSFATIGGALGAVLAAKLIGQNSNYDALLQVSILIYIIAASFLIISIKLKNTHE